MVTCTKKFEGLPFAHRQHSHDGHCAYIHGHSWTFQLTFASDFPDANGFVLDFGKMGVLKEFFAHQFDHTLVIAESDPQLPLFKQMNNDGLCRLIVVDSPSAEGLATYVYSHVTALLSIIEQAGNPRNVRLVEVICFEEPKAFATFIP